MGRRREPHIKKDALDEILNSLDRGVKEGRREKDSDHRKTESSVFDRRTVMTVYKAISDELITRIEHPISEGKEAVVYRASAVDGTPLAVKIYLISTSSFKRIGQYINGDPRFTVARGKKEYIIYTWTKKEYKNLERMEGAGVRVPMPVWYRNNVLIMEYIGDENGPAPLLRDWLHDGPDPDSVEKLLTRAVEYLDRCVRKANLVHADFSEFNILVMDGEPVVIDVGQAVVLEHPEALSLLERDIKNTSKLLKLYDIDMSDKLMAIMDYARNHVE